MCGIWPSGTFSCPPSTVRRPDTGTTCLGEAPLRGNGCRTHGPGGGVFSPDVGPRPGNGCRIAGCYLGSRQESWAAASEGGYNVLNTAGIPNRRSTPPVQRTSPFAAQPTAAQAAPSCTIVWSRGRDDFTLDDASICEESLGVTAGDLRDLSRWNRMLGRDRASPRRPTAGSCVSFRLEPAGDHRDPVAVALRSSHPHVARGARSSHVGRAPGHSWLEDGGSPVESMTGRCACDQDHIATIHRSFARTLVLETSEASHREEDRASSSKPCFACKPAMLR